MRGFGYRSIRVTMAGIALLLATPTTAQSGKSRWVASWAASQMAVEDRNALSSEDLTDTTLRQTIHLTAGGQRIRVRLANNFGIGPLRLKSVHVARAAAPGSAAIDPASDRAVTFAGQGVVIIPEGATYLSDPVDLAVKPLDNLAISFHIAQPPARQTGHPGSRTTTHIVKGDHVADTNLEGARTVERWHQIAGIDVETDRKATAVVAFGDSITDGNGSTTNGNDRWPDILAARLQENRSTRHISVLNHGIGGNRLLQDGTGPNALARFERDVLGQPGVRYLIILEGINDIGNISRDRPSSKEEHAALVARMIAAYQQMVAKARSGGIRVYGATILPFAGSDYSRRDPLNEADRQAVNQWIRTPGNFDAVIDFDAAIRDPQQSQRMLPAYDKGDGLHPSAAGYKTMGEAIPLSLFNAMSGNRK